MKKRLFLGGFLQLILFGFCFRGVLIAQPLPTEAEKQKELNEYIKFINIQEASSKFENLGFGIAFTVSTFLKNFVTDAEVENGIIRLKKEQSLFGEIMLETHKFWSIKTKAFENKYIKVESNTIGAGPFLGILMDSNSSNMINSLASGLMVGFRPDTSSPNSLNIGIGLTARFKISELRGDLILDKPLPVGITEVKYQESTKVGFIFVFSFTWANM